MLIITAKVKALIKVLLNSDQSLHCLPSTRLAPALYTFLMKKKFHYTVIANLYWFFLQNKPMFETVASLA